MYTLRFFGYIWPLGSVRRLDAQLLSKFPDCYPRIEDQWEEILLSANGVYKPGGEWMNEVNRLCEKYGFPSASVSLYGDIAKSWRPEDRKDQGVILYDEWSEDRPICEPWPAWAPGLDAWLSYFGIEKPQAQPDWWEVPIRDSDRL